MTQGKIEGWQRIIKNVVKRENYYSPEELEKAIADFVEYYSNERYHHSLDNLAPAEVYHDRSEEVVTRRENIKRRMLRRRRKQLNLHASRG